MPKVDWEKNGRPVQFWQKKMDQGVHFFLPKVDLPCQKWTWSNFVKKKWTWSSFTAMSSTSPFLAREKSGPSPVSLPKSKQVHFWRGKKVDPVQFHCQNLSRSIFGEGKKWTWSSFTWSALQPLRELKRVGGGGGGMRSVETIHART